VRIERRAVRLDSRQTRAFDDAAQLRIDELDALADVLVDVALFEVAYGELETVEHRQELFEEALGGPLDQTRLLAQHPPPVVLEVGLEPSGRVEQVVALALQ